MILVRPLWSVAFGVIALGCGSSNPEVNPTPHSVEISPKGPLTVRQGDVVPLGIIVRDRTGQGIFHGPISFASSAPQVATAAETSPSSWALTALAPGKAIIQAETEGAVGQMTVNVTVWPRGEVSGGAFGAAARGTVAMVTTLDAHVDRIDPASGARRPRCSPAATSCTRAWKGSTRSSTGT